jgi:hypothetical protein
MVRLNVTERRLIPGQEIDYVLYDEDEVRIKLNNGDLMTINSKIVSDGADGVQPLLEFNIIEPKADGKEEQ